MSAGCQGGDITYNLEINTSKATKAMFQFQLALYGVLGILHRLGLPEPIDAAIVKVQRLIAALNMLRVTLIATQAASGPLGWAMAGVSIAGSVLGVADLAMEFE